MLVNMRGHRRSNIPQTAGRMLFATVLAVLTGGAACPAVHADAGVVLNESLDTGIARITGSGHSAVYFSRICPESPVRVRLCGQDEEGSVISVYGDLSEDQPFGWNVMPLSAYLYGARSLQERPLLGSTKIKAAIDEGYRRNYLAGYCSAPLCATNRKAGWHDTVGAAFDRSIYIFVVTTTVDQDLDMIARLDALPNRDRFNGITRNCADFTRALINSYFPDATHPDYLNDFGMTSPKAIARSFARFAERHPETDFRVVRFSQIPGSIKRSSDCRDGTEQIFRAKEWAIPMLVLASHELPIFIASYGLTARFNPQHELEQHSTARATELGNEIEIAKSKRDDARANQLKAARNEEQAEILGTKEEWATYRRLFEPFVEQAIGEEVVSSRESLHGLAREIGREGTPFLDSQGGLWIEVRDGGATQRVGLTASNVLAAESDARLAYDVLLAHVDFVLRSHKHDRESMADFRQDWGLLMQARENVAGLTASSQPMRSGN
jgi:hypothetical protein